MARVIALQHYGCETLGAIADALQRSRIQWSARVTPNSGETCTPNNSKSDNRNFWPPYFSRR